MNKNISWFLILILLLGFNSITRAALLTQSQPFSINPGPEDTDSTSVSFQPFNQSLGELDTVSWFLDKVVSSGNCTDGGTTCPGSSRLSLIDPFDNSYPFGVNDSFYTTAQSQTFDTGDLLGNIQPVTDPFLGNDPVAFSLNLRETQVAAGPIDSRWTGIVTLQYEFTNITGDVKTNTQIQSFTVYQDSSNVGTESIAFQPFDSSQGDLTGISWELSEVVATVNCTLFCAGSTTRLSIDDPYGDNMQVATFSPPDGTPVGATVSSSFDSPGPLSDLPPQLNPFLDNEPVDFDLLKEEFEDLFLFGISSGWSGDLVLLYDFKPVEDHTVSVIPVPGAIYMFGTALLILVSNGKRKGMLGVKKS